jgi:hypothetical protein
MTSPLQIREELVHALRLDLIGPTGALGDHNEILPQTPSRWYLTAFLVPRRMSQKAPRKHQPPEPAQRRRENRSPKPTTSKN